MGGIVPLPDDVLAVIERIDQELKNDRAG
jgi:hypothetical protein